MSGYQEKQPFMNTYSPIRESSREGSAGAAAAGVYYDDDDGAVPPSWCGCFRLCGFGSGGGDARHLIGGEDNGGRGSWLGEKLKKLKEFSEVVAGPKWKNALRKIGKYCNPKKGKTTAFQYDAESYALNFADGMPEEEGDGLLRNFSTRFAAPGQRVGGGM
ncbi:PREDICTED: uncharacterized protein LOC109191783 [Ipomoea nil]|uniref:uncharacterized protein LOC109191783 n=1 Tax=Ipomoea nil TaxID=35883 RepID=UPI000901427B|nr:PREDICTED: uncharacterized protein LOC109191783 [Ipomoea nil]XP_019197991.1 PREDICTED: uncharacterized protein LOC109191783 [Ipomoea nil]XP_019197992.1 PREDICTED: uncharacterized protein LOC109191783 [Ipomoea nil]